MRLLILGDGIAAHRAAFEAARSGVAFECLRDPSDLSLVARWCIEPGIPDLTGERAVRSVDCERDVEARLRELGVSFGFENVGTEVALPERDEAWPIAGLGERFDGVVQASDGRASLWSDVEMTAREGGPIISTSASSDAAFVTGLPAAVFARDAFGCDEALWAAHFGARVHLFLETDSTRASPCARDELSRKLVSLEQGVRFERVRVDGTETVVEWSEGGRRCCGRFAATFLVDRVRAPRPPVHPLVIQAGLVETGDFAAQHALAESGARAVHCAVEAMRGRLG